MTTTHTPPTQRTLYGYICMDCSFYRSGGNHDQILAQVHAHCHQTQHIVKAGEDV